MSAQPIAGATPAPATSVGKIPQVVIDETRFEGKEVGSTLLTISGGAKLIPQSADHDNTVLTHDDVVTVQLDVKVSGVSYEVDNNGVLVRVQKARPIEGTAQIVDVLRARDTKIR